MINSHVADGRSHKKLLYKGSQPQHILREFDSVSSVADLRPSSVSVQLVCKRCLLQDQRHRTLLLAVKARGPDLLTMRSSTILVAVTMLALIGPLSSSLLCLWCCWSTFSYSGQPACATVTACLCVPAQ